MQEKLCGSSLFRLMIEKECVNRTTRNFLISGCDSAIPHANVVGFFVLWCWLLNSSTAVASVAAVSWRKKRQTLV